MKTDAAALEQALERACELAWDALGLLRRTPRGQVRHKGPIDLVTDADRASEALLAAGLRQSFPGWRLLLEEGGAEGQGEGPIWYVDPLDGTTNFAHGFPHCSVTLALEEQGELLLGVVADVGRQEVYAARRGGGAWVQDVSGQRQPLQVSATDTLSEALLATGFPYDRHTSAEDNLAPFAAFLKRVQGMRRAGSAALDLAFVARGWLDGYWEMKLNPWDVAAGALLVQEAGGFVTDYAGEPCRRWGPRTLASNGRLHEAMRAQLAASGAGSR